MDTFTSDRGAFISHTYVGRDVKAYAILEHEVTHLSTFNTLATVGYSVASALLAFAVGIWTNWAFAEKMTPEGAIMSKVVAPGLLALAIISFGLAVWATFSRSSTWEAIKKQSKISAPNVGTTEKATAD